MTRPPPAPKAVEEPPAPPTDPDPVEPAVSPQGPRFNRYPEFEVALGAKIRAVRVGVGMSQTDLGRVLDVSYQQIQKYERGADRVSASTLKSLAEALGVHPGSFFDDIPMPTGRIHELREMLNAAAVLQRIRDPETRRQLVALAEELARAERVEP